MATPQEKLSDALCVLKALQDKGILGIQSADIPNVMHRRILVKYGFIKEITKGWYIASNPDERDGESTSWYSAYWDFSAVYLDKKYGKDWCLSPEQSLLLHAGNKTVPDQLVIRSPKGNNNATPFPHQTSMFNLKTHIPPENQIVQINGLRVYDLASALIYSSPAVYKFNPIDARTTLAMIRDASEVLGILLTNGHSKLAGRLAGAFRNIGNDKIADQIISTFKSAHYDIREEDPFSEYLPIKLDPRERSPHVNRIKLMWQKMRTQIIPLFPETPGIPKNLNDYLKHVDDIYTMDAYHSLSIERYRVTPELIEKVSSGKWNFKENEEDRRQKDAMAARGYYQSFQQVKNTIKHILEGNNPGEQVENDHGRWYRELFDPSVSAGILDAKDLAGYRTSQVYIGNSKHVPLHVEAMRDTMPVLFDLLKEEPETSVRVVLGHFMFVFIHPYMDGNGRIGRFLMNTMLASGGYPWTVIPVEARAEYMEALEKASVEQNIVPFAQFISKLVNQSLSNH